jgi:predicted permease
MILRECRRFFRSSLWLSLTGVLLLTIGVGSSAVTYCFLVAFSAPRFPGMRAQGYATIGAEEASSVLFPISWWRKETLDRVLGNRMQVAAYSPSEAGVDLAAESVHRTIKVAAVSADFFSAFAGPLLAGRDFSETEAGDRDQHAVILGAALATSLFGSPQHSLGGTVALNGMAYQVIGVAEPAFHGLFGDDAEAWTPAHSVIPLQTSLPPPYGDEASMWKTIDSFYLLAADRHLSSESLAVDLSRRLLNASGNATQLTAAPGISLDPERDKTMRHWLRLALGFSQLIAVISCLNVCMLLLARAPLLVEEVKLKQSLGASQRRIVCELVAGPLAMMSAGVSGAFLFCFAAWLAAVRTSNLNSQLLRGSIGEMASSLALTLLVAFGLIAIAALVPAAVVLRSSHAPRMGSTATASRYTVRLMQAQVSVQIGCGIVVAILASMIATAFLATIRQSLGFQFTHRMIVSIEPARGWVTFSGTPGASAEFLALRRVMTQLRSIPEVRSVSYTRSAPFGETPLSIKTVENPARPAAPSQAQHNLITADYFRTVGSRILRGRGLSDWVETGISHEAVINEQLTRQLFGDEDPVGKTIFVREPAQNGLAANRYSLTVVGMVENTRDAGYASSPRPAFFEDAHASTDAMPHLVVDSDLSSHALEQAAQNAVQSLMPDYKVRQVYSLSGKVAEAVTPDEYRAAGALAGALAMDVMACIGLYSALFFFVRTKRREIAVRICLGATPSSIRRMVVFRALEAAAASTLLSLPVWLFLQSLSSHNLLGPASWSATRAILITLVGVTASVLLALVPAARAMAEPPATVLKEQ